MSRNRRRKRASTSSDSRERVKDRPPQRREPAASPYPPLGVSLAAGFRAVGASPMILTIAFLGAFAAWSGSSAVGAEPSPRLMVNLMTLPPVHVYFDLVVVRTAAQNTASAAVLILSVGAARSLIVGLLALLIVGTFREGRPDVRNSLRRLPRTALILFLLFSIEVAGLLTVPSLVQTIGGVGLAVLGLLATLTIGLHFLVFAPVIAAAEGGQTAQVLRRSVRAARLPGTRHLLFVVAYFAFVFWAATITPTEAVAPATPGAMVWAFTLLATFIHTAALGALAFRWLAVREEPVVSESTPSRGR
jgi:hypothetical protein